MPVAYRYRLPLRVRKRLAPYQSRQNEIQSVHFLFLGDLPATLSFTGPTNLTVTTNKGMTGGLSFTAGALQRAISKGMTATLGFTGLLNRFITTALASASLSFVGLTTKKTITSFTGTLSFTGAFSSITHFVKAFPATLSFTGSQSKQISKGMTGGLSFTGAMTKFMAIGKTATLTFTGANVKATVKGITGNLSFSTSNSRFITKGMTAGLSFSGNIAKRIAKALTGAVSFVGTFSTVKTFHMAFNATLSFVGTGPSKVIRTNLDSSLSFFTSFLNVKLPKMISFTANLNSSGNLTNLHWYYGTFKQGSAGIVRAVSRAISNMITQRQAP